MKGNEVAAAFFGVLAALCLGASRETWVMAAMGVALGVCGVVAWFWKPAKRRRS